MVSLNGLVNGLNGDSKTPARPLALAHGSIRVQLVVPEADWVAASILREAFVDFVAQDDDASAALTPLELDSEEDVDRQQTQRDQALLLALFLRFTADHLHQDASRTEAYLSVLLSAYAHLVDAYLDRSDLHSFAASLEPHQRTLFIRAFYEANTTLKQNHKHDLPRTSSSLLFTQAPGLQAVFGGQGLNEIYFDEMQVSQARICCFSGHLTYTCFR